MPESTITTPEGRTDLNLDLGLTLQGGVQVPVEVFIVYPEGMGFHAVKAVEKLVTENMNQIYQELLNRRDKSLIDTMLANGAEYEDDEL